MGERQVEQTPANQEVRLFRRVGLFFCASARLPVLCRQMEEGDALPAKTAALRVACVLISRFNASAERRPPARGRFVLEICRQNRFDCVNRHSERQDRCSFNEARNSFEMPGGAMN